MKKKSTISNPVPTIGMGVTIQYHSDREPGTIIQITQNGKRIVIQEDTSNRTDNNGMSESQSYEFEANPQGSIHIATLRKDGSYRFAGEYGRGSTRVYIGTRSKYYDYSF